VLILGCSDHSSESESARIKESTARLLIMFPIVTPKRAELKGGLWTPRAVGEFEEGATDTEFYITGSAEIKELQGQLKLFFRDVKIMHRRAPVEEEEKPKEEADKEVSENDGKDQDGDGDGDGKVVTDEEGGATGDDTIGEKKDNSDMAGTLYEDKKDVEEVVLDNPDIVCLHLYFSKKNPKTRMVDIHKRGTKIYLNRYNSDGYFGKKGTLNDFEVSLKSIPDVLLFRGLVVVKLPGDKPLTDDPVVYGFIKIQSAKSLTVNTASEMNFSEITDIISKATDSVGNRDDTQKKKSSDRVKPLAHYRKNVKKAWLHFNLQDGDEVNLKKVMQILQYLNIFLLDIQAQRILEAVDIEGDRELGTSEMVNFLIAYDLLGPTANIDCLDIFDTLKVKAAQTNMGNHIRGGLDFSGFCEGVHMLGVRADDEDLMKVFCSASGVPEKDADTAFIDLASFKKGWIKMAHVSDEMKARNMDSEVGMLGAGRNRDRLFRYLTTAEDEYLGNIARVNEVVEKIKKTRRELKDKKRNEIQEYRDALVHAANNITALRNQEKRLVLKRDQEERSKKRLEDKVLRNNLLLKQAANKQAKKEELRDLLKQKDKLRADQIVAMGLDKLDLSVQGMRELEKELYIGEEAHMKLSFLVVFDLSRNRLEYLPELGFMYWLTNLRFLKLSQNRLPHIPREIGLMAKLEVLELDSNRLLHLPVEFAELVTLQRLDLSNNRIESLPNDLFDKMTALRYLNIHSNDLVYLPTTIGSCLKLEHVDCSRNNLIELPEDMRLLNALMHIDVNANRLGALPQGLGQCQALSYIDASTNLIASLPPTFSKLRNLTYCNMESNEITSNPYKFNECVKLVQLRLKRNDMRVLYPDIGFCISLEILDLSNNKLSSLPAEIGLLVSLVELTLNYNELDTIPPEFGSCKKLIRLEMRHNLIQGGIPETVGLMSSLQHIDLSFNSINHIPRSVVGLKEIRDLLLFSNLIEAVPDTILSLEYLSKLDLGRNKFTRFPIELCAVMSLKELNLNKNLLTLLPRNIDVMTHLESLDLSQNRLRAVPVEFTDILESVLNVNLAANPWDDLPERWGKVWSADLQKDVPRGNSVPEAVDFLYGMKAFYNTAERIWADVGALHYTNKLGLSDFIQELRERIPRTWHEGLTKHVEHVYFKAKEYGVFPRWYHLDDDALNMIEHRKKVDGYIREKQVHNTRVAHDNLKIKLARSYDLENSLRAVRNQGSKIERRMDGELFYNTKMINLMERVKESDYKESSRTLAADLKQKHVTSQEAQRLNSIIAENRKSHPEKWSGVR